MAKRTTTPTKPTKQINAPDPGATINWTVWLPVIAAALVYAVGLGNEMVGLDDHASTTENPFVIDFSLDKIFNGTFNLGMYAPVTWFGYAISYTLSSVKDNGFWYHLMSWGVHIFNTWLVVRLLQRLSLRPTTVLVTALLFGIHPIQAESVSWIAGFSTPMYCMFCLLSMLYYLRFAAGEDKRWQHYGLALAMFLLACLAKSAAVCLPLLLVVLDWWKQPKYDLKTRIAAYTPFFLIALGFGLLTIYSRNVSGTYVGAPSVYTAFERVLLVCYAPLFYLTKLLLPFKFNIYYSFDKINGQLPWYYLMAPVLMAALGFACWRFRKTAPYLYIGMAFFLANIFFTLPFASLGTFELCADHYNYLACIGIFYILAEGFEALCQRYTGAAGSLRLLARGAIIVVAIFGMLQARIWKDTITVISNAINNGYYHRGMMYFGRGVEYGDLGKPQLAMQDMTKALELDPTMKDAYRFRGSLYGNMGQLDAALSDLLHYTESDPADAVVWLNIGNIYQGKGMPQKAIEAYSKSIAAKPKAFTAYRERAKIYRQIGDLTNAAADEAKALELAKAQRDAGK